MNFMNGMIEKLIKSSLDMKEDFDRLKTELRSKTVSAASGGGMVRVEANARFEILKIDIEDSVFKSNDKAMVQELVKAATNEALRKAEQTAIEELKSLGSRLNLPLDPGMFFK